jgi:hypothetical protein
VLAAVTGGAIAAYPGSAAAARGARSPRLLEGDGAPAPGRGRTGDFYLDASGTRLYGPKAGGAKERRWRAAARLQVERGARVRRGAGPPPAELGRDGDWYLDSAATQLYGPKGGGLWGSPAGLTGPSSAAERFRALAAEPEGLFAGDIERGPAGCVKAAGVRWPDGTPGRFEATRISEAFPGAVDSYTITYGDPPVRVYRQPPVTRDRSTGAVTHRPPLEVD